MMTASGDLLRDAVILIVEDEYYLASDLQAGLEAAGATIVGPFASEVEAEQALAVQVPDCAFVDVNLGGGPSFAVAHALADRSVPFVFVTGYDAGIIPPAFADIARYEKPVDVRKAIEAAAALLSRDIAPPVPL